MLIATGNLNFDRAYLEVEHLEHGWWAGDKPSDPNPTLNGVTQKTYDRFRRLWHYPPQSVKLMTPGEQRLVYQGYWDESGAGSLDWPVALVHYDTGFNSGAGNAKILGRRAGWDWERYLVVRQGYYDAIVREHPDQKPNTKGWTNRLARLKAYILENLS